MSTKVINCELAISSIEIKIQRLERHLEFLHANCKTKTSTLRQIRDIRLKLRSLIQHLRGLEASLAKARVSEAAEQFRIEMREKLRAEAIADKADPVTNVAVRVLEGDDSVGDNSSVKIVESKASDDDVFKRVTTFETPAVKKCDWFNKS